MLVIEKQYIDAYLNATILSKNYLEKLLAEVKNLSTTITETVIYKNMFNVISTAYDLVLDMEELCKKAVFIEGEMAYPENYKFEEISNIENKVNTAERYEYLMHELYNAMRKIGTERTIFAAINIAEEKGNIYMIELKVAKNQIDSMQCRELYGPPDFDDDFEKNRDDITQQATIYGPPDFDDDFDTSFGSWK